MKIQKQLNKRIGNKWYYKFVVILPSNLLKILRWDESTNLHASIDSSTEGRKLVLIKLKKSFKDR